MTALEALGFFALLSLASIGGIVILVCVVRGARETFWKKTEASQ
jgi:hypothetical protein